MPPSFEPVTRLLSRVFPQRTIKDCNPLSGGLINTNLKIDFESNDAPVVLRMYRDGPDVCRKEVAIHNLVRSEVPVPEILHAEPDGSDDLASFAILEFVTGLTFQELKRTNNLDAIRQASYSVGKTLAAIGRFQFPRPGRLMVGGELVVGSRFIDGADPIPRLLDKFLASPLCEQRAGANLIRRLHDFSWAWSSQLPDLDENSCLVHSDFGNRNILVREEKGRWVVAGVLDWEFSFSGSPLLDVGHFLRHEQISTPLREPHFSRAFIEHGGILPDNWREIVRVIDLTALVECLTHDDLPADVEAELLELINATLEHRDPK
ncbi:MAG TPA: phosphotransferase [Pyrinomonadaceae bacterium]|jgi:aminoglycoside phosphotransferase (APT) family kinase protein|nr:phosphotransferase [Pyrinomonadaceae bacterium]